MLNRALWYRRKTHLFEAALGAALAARVLNRQACIEVLRTMLQPPVSLLGADQLLGFMEQGGLSLCRSAVLTAIIV
jgi:hypothetical protein